MAKKVNKYELYEQSVQSTEIQTDIFHLIYWELRRKTPYHFREDFCGTFSLSVEWVKGNAQNTAISLDLDPEPLAYGRQHHLPKLTAGEKKRLTVKKQNVMTVTSPKVDIIGACNFSFFIFKERKTLVNYFRYCLKSLAKGGIIVLEMAGGPGMIEQKKEHKTVRTESGRKFRYVWHQKSFNPIDRNGHYAIHFKFADGQVMHDAFTYDWRVWTMPEVCDALIEAGFKKTCVYWDRSDNPAACDYYRTVKADNDHAWISQVVGVK